VDVYLMLPQMRMSMEAVVERAVAAESAGFGGIVFIDHLVPPMANEMPILDGMLTATWVAAHTTTLRIGHLVLCDAFRHPAVLAKQAVTLDHASGGRFELGIGWGSWTPELKAFGVGAIEPRTRVARLAETLEVLELLFSGEQVSYDGVHHQLADAQCRPVPLGRIPVLVGGVGPKTLALAAKHADWWNLPVYGLDRLDELRPQVGRARVSVQTMVSFVPPGGDRDQIIGTATRRFAQTAADGGMLTGDTDEVVAGLAAFAGKGVERVYVWFADFAPPETLHAFAPVIQAARALP
jgi:alkanesulfonate monooxygenase SsuD/methylene tetrahydromethanopterin reductase-like flavin-dependent oxidoreductase (luciferase family)